ncbi:MAG: hypothetical protein JWQ10_4033, partial [Herbaspirillum sp.]|nr:hypothetical protein [Herbaspirillum sp.]
GRKRPYRPGEGHGGLIRPGEGKALN